MVSKGGSGLGYLIIDRLPVPGDNGPTLRSLAAFRSLHIDELKRRKLR